MSERRLTIAERKRLRDEAIVDLRHGFINRREFMLRATAAGVSAAFAGKIASAVAAPTPALHFTPRLMEALAEAGIAHETLTLHVGAGTFLPVKAEDTEAHVMHSEWGRIDAAAAVRIDEARRRGGRIIPVGTTSLRLLESAAAEDGAIRPFEGDTDIFITPGYRFRAVDGLITNFHLPRSTLFMLVSALMGRETMQAAYAHAIQQGYRFYSYGDASLLLPAQ